MTTKDAVTELMHATASELREAAACAQAKPDWADIAKALKNAADVMEAGANRIIELEDQAFDAVCNEQ